MGENKALVLEKYLQILGNATGKEIENIRAKIAWYLTETVFKDVGEPPISFAEIKELISQEFIKEFPFCDEIVITEKDADHIVISMENCHLKNANIGFEKRGGYSLCPIDPFLNFTLSRALNCNICLLELDLKETGCTMEFSLANRCEIRE